MGKFQTNLRRSGEHCLIQPIGDLDLASASVFSDAFSEACKDDAVERITVDLSGVPFVDSTGLRILIESANLAETAEVALAFERPSPQLSRLLELTKTSSVLPLAD